VETRRSPINKKSNNSTNNKQNVKNIRKSEEDTINQGKKKAKHDIFNGSHDLSKAKAMLLRISQQNKQQ